MSTDEELEQRLVDMGHATDTAVADPGPLVVQLRCAEERCGKKMGALHRSSRGLLYLGQTRHGTEWDRHPVLLLDGDVVLLAACPRHGNTQVSGSSLLESAREARTAMRAVDVRIFVAR